LGVSLIDRSQPKGVKPKKRGRKLRIDVKLEGALKRNALKRKDIPIRNNEIVRG